MEGPLLVHAVDRAAPLEGGDQLGVEDVVARGVARLPGVVEDPAIGVGDDGPGHALRLHPREGRAHVLLRQLVQSRHRRVDGRRPAEEGRVLGAEHQVLADQQGIGVHEHDDDHQKGDVPRADPQL